MVCNETRDQILKHKGIIKVEQEQKNILAPKVCPLSDCKSSNPFDALKCSVCGYIFSFEERKRVKEQEEQVNRESREEVQILREEMAGLKKLMSVYLDNYSREKGSEARKPKMEWRIGTIDSPLTHYKFRRALVEECMRELEYMRAHREEISSQHL
ncbi:MAG TPA: hypothetical protein VEL11_09720 [Candidatus Bathyarchaeia archaeon]|nr:hypothetical protein [Candidatus Bathyarchaeia archaeon]